MTETQNLSAMLDVLCPMHLIVSPSGHILHCGPTLSKLRDTALIGQRLLEVFEMKRPRRISSVSDLRQLTDGRLQMQFRDGARTVFKGVVVPAGTENLVINLSFGISVVDAVRDYKLSNRDFAPTDLTIEMLYLVEAKSAAMESSRTLNQRLQGAKIAAEEQAYTDTLTGLKNRRALDHILARYAKWQTQFALMHVDLDWFKAVNDTLGHAAGDHVLQVFAGMLVNETRDSDTVARTGGDEFVILLPNACQPEKLRSIGQRIIAHLKTPIMFGPHECRVSASIGTALYEPGEGVSIAELMEQADAALYASKRAGRACQTLYTPDLPSVDMLPEDKAAAKRA